jgi:hypothetical protein
MTELLLNPQETEEEKLFRTLQMRGLVDLFGLNMQEAVTRPEDRYLHARIRINDRAIEARYQECVRESGVEISADARQLIKTVLNAILSDPHPAWNATPEERVEVVGQYLEKLPQTLTAVVRAGRVKGQPPSGSDP